MELRISSFGSPLSSNVTKPLHWWSGKGGGGEGLKTSTSHIQNHNGGKHGNRGAWNAHLAGCRYFGLCLWDTGFACSSLFKMHFKTTQF